MVKGLFVLFVLGKQVWDAKGYQPFSETRRKPLD